MKIQTTALLTFSLSVFAAAPATAQAPTGLALGATVYGQQCARCHVARSPAERSDAAWSIIVKHMRSKANLTKTQSSAVLVFLQATNGLPAASPAAPDALLARIPGLPGIGAHWIHGERSQRAEKVHVPVGGDR